MKTLLPILALLGLGWVFTRNSNAAATGKRRLEILEAHYGLLDLDGLFWDVRDIVAARVNDTLGILDIPATNETFGDPAEGNEKQLRVRYRFTNPDGSVGPLQTAIVDEGAILSLPDLGLE